MPLWQPLLQPSPAQVQRLIDDSVDKELNYEPSHVGCTRDASRDTLKLPPGPWWHVDHVRVKLGEGRGTYDAAKRLVQQWRQFQLGWTQVASDTPVREGQAVAVMAHTLFMWSVNPLRITYVHEGPVPKRAADHPHSHGESFSRRLLFWAKPQRPLRWQFAHGCVHGHALTGEEAFRLEWDPLDDSVWYEVLTFSRPVDPLAFVSYPLTRFFQHRFGQDSVAALKAGLAGAAPPPLTQGWIKRRSVTSR